MQFIGEMLVTIFLEIIAYGIGRAFLLVLAPHAGTELDLVETPDRKWKWRGWSFQHNGRKYFYVESVQLVGLLVAGVFAVLAALAGYLKP